MNPSEPAPLPRHTPVLASTSTVPSTAPSGGHSFSWAIFHNFGLKRPDLEEAFSKLDPLVNAAVSNPTQHHFMLTGDLNFSAPGVVPHRYNAPSGDFDAEPSENEG